MTYILAGPTDRTQEGIRQALLAHGYGSLWEHKWFDYTTCSNGRDDWPWLMPELEEDDMALTQEDKDWLIQLRNDGVDSILEELAAMDTRNESRYKQLRADIKAVRDDVGTGSTADESRYLQLRADIAAIGTDGDLTHDHSFPAGRTGKT